jgi:hypothetical protein
MPLFDAYLFVDWSARQGVLPAQPRADAPWIGERLRDSRWQCETYHRSREAAVLHLQQRLLKHVRASRRVLVGFDFALGYPTGFTQALGWTSSEAPWQRTWRELSARLREYPGNRSNRFDVARGLNELCGGARPGPFWARPENAASASLPPRSPGFPFVAQNGTSLVRRRATELALPRTQETWKLAGVGAVGSQTLVGIPIVQHLRQSPELRDCCRVFPFETRFTATPTPDVGPAIVCTETFFGIVADATAEALRLDPSLVRDRVQVRAQCRWVAELDRRDRLGEWFAEPTGLTPAQRAAALEEEGWILGARTTGGGSLPPLRG